MNELKQMLAYTGIDVERLVDDYTKTLHENNNRFATREASVMAIKEWAAQKDYLIHQVMDMPGYNGNLQAVKLTQVPNDRQSYDVRNAVDTIWTQLFDKGNKILSKTNDDGKTVEQVIEDNLSEMPEFINIGNITEYNGKTVSVSDEFDGNGYTIKSKTKVTNVRELINIFRYMTESRLPNELAERINDINPKIRAAEGMKTSRALGKVIKYYGLEDKSAGSVYTETYIKGYCEVMKEGGRKMLFVVSVNPIDYLKMSIGEFTSCHNINGGGWRSGTISYMLDNVTLITYTINPQSVTNADPVTGEIFLGKDRPELFSKIYRNCFWWDENHRLIQSRVYPQGKDGCTDLYSVLRHEMQSQISLANGWDENNWTNRKRKYMEFTIAGEGATNYPDWQYDRFGGNLSTPGHSTDPYSKDEFAIGAKPMCIICGRRHDRSDRLVCHNH